MPDYQKELEDLLLTVVRESASDLHLSVGMQPHIRVAGRLEPLASKETLSKEDTFEFASVLLGDEKKEQFLEDQEVDFSYAFSGGARFRCNAYYQSGCVSVAMRLIPEKVRTLAELNLPPILEDFCDRRQGLFLVVGPIGQGKSTTLASMVNLVNQSRPAHILTIEDPIEYLFTEDKAIVDQREIHLDTESFPTALRSMFREDVDVLMTGEMRGRETIGTTVTAAETGHLVFSTLHTNDAAQTIDRIVDSFPAVQQNQIKLQLAGALLGVFSIRLVPRVDGGRVPAYELLINNNAIANLIRQGRTHEIPSVIETSSAAGMVDMNQSLARLVQSGEIEREQAVRHASNIKEIENLLS